MTNKPKRPKTCPECGYRFVPTRSFQPVCEKPECARSHSANASAKPKRIVSKKMPAKPKKPKISTLITKADNLASHYIRQKYADHAGNVTCITCAKVLPWKDAHCAHYIERAAKKTRWMEENLHPACPSCNVFRKEFHKREYTLYMVDTYGRQFLDELKVIIKEVCASSEVRQLADEAISHYSAMIKERGFE